MDRLLNDKEMLQPIWDMGVALEGERRVPEQIDRFRAIAQAQDKKTLRFVGKWLEKQTILIKKEGVFDIPAGMNELIEALKRGEFPE